MIRQYELLALGLSRGDARLVAKQVNARGRGADAARVVLEYVGHAMGGHGVECIRAESDPRSGPAIAEYVNVGDPYKVTLLYDIARDRWHVGGWGDWPHLPNA